MSSTLNFIMLTIRNALDASLNITSPSAILDAVGQLEIFPMTMTQLQDTRIGQLLQTIRHKVDPPLQKRIRFIIKSWQKLLLPEFASQSVIPLKCKDSSGSVPLSHLPGNQKPNGTCRLPIPPVAPPLILSANHPGNSNAVQLNSNTNSLKRTRSSPVRLVEQHSNDISGINCTVTEQMSIVPSKRHKALSRTSHITSPKRSVHSPLVNGGQHMNSTLRTTSISPTIPSSPVSVRQPVTVTVKKTDKSKVTRLAKVKSTAELLQSASDCLDSVTVNRILTNRINKEEDPARPPVVPYLSKPRQLRGTPTTCGSNRLNRQSTSTSSSEVDAILSSTSVLGHRKGSDSLNPEGPSVSILSSIHAHESNNRIPLRKNETSIPADCYKPDRPINVPLVDTDSDSQKASRHIRGKKKHKHRHKHRPDDADCHNNSVTTAPPITNRLDDWPVLPPLTDNIDWNSLDKNSPSVENLVPESVTADRLLYDALPGINCTIDDDGNPHSFSELYSLTLDDRYLHVLPWFDMYGARRQFFPPGTENLDELTSLPEPW